MQKEKLKSTIVARMNNIDLVVIEDGEKYVAIEPICKVLGIVPHKELEKMKKDLALNDELRLVSITNPVGKLVEMDVISYKYVFAWLYGLNVDAQDKATQLECYSVLWNYITEYTAFLKMKGELIAEKLVAIEHLDLQFQQAKLQLLEAKEELQAARNLTYNKHLS